MRGIPDKNEATSSMLSTESQTWRLYSACRVGRDGMVLVAAITHVDGRAN